METPFIPSCAVLEALVMAFQVIGVASLCLTRFLPGTVWAYRGRRVFVISLMGLGLTGAMCGAYDSSFALFAGATLTALLIGMIAGGTPIDLIAPTVRRASADVAVIG